jgi:hypothetical protein
LTADKVDVAVVIDDAQVLDELMLSLIKHILPNKGVVLYITNGSELHDD